MVYIKLITSQNMLSDASYRKKKTELDIVCANSYLQAFDCSFSEFYYLKLFCYVKCWKTMKHLNNGDN